MQIVMLLLYCHISNVFRSLFQTLKLSFPYHISYVYFQNYVTYVFIRDDLSFVCCWNAWLLVFVFIFLLESRMCVCIFPFFFLFVWIHYAGWTPIDWFAKNSWKSHNMTIKSETKQARERKNNGRTHMYLFISVRRAIGRLSLSAFQNT